MKTTPYVKKIAVEAPAYSELVELIHANLLYGSNLGFYAMEVNIKQREDGRWRAELSGTDVPTDSNATEVYELAIQNTYGEDQ